MLSSTHFLNLCLVATLGLVSMQSYAETDAELMASGQWRDPATGLIWDRCLIGQKWSGKTCIGGHIGYVWSGAKEQVQNHRLGGHVNWQLPTIAQLRTLVRCDDGFTGSSKISAAPFSGDFEVFQECMFENKEKIPRLDAGVFMNASSGLHWTSSVADVTSDFANRERTVTTSHTGANGTVIVVSFTGGFWGGVKVKIITEEDTSPEHKATRSSQKVDHIVHMKGDFGSLLSNILPVARAVRIDRPLERERFIAFFEREKTYSGSDWKTEHLQSTQVAAFPVQEIQSYKGYGVENEKLMPQGMWKDSTTGLIWDRCSLGQVWDGKACIGEAKQYLWSDAVDAAKHHVKGGNTDWRLPKIEELATIRRCNIGWESAYETRVYSLLTPDGLKDFEQKIYKNGMAFTTLMVPNGKRIPKKCTSNSSRPTLETLIFPNTPDAWAWSVTPYASDHRLAWGVGFDEGHSNFKHKDGGGHVRAVRAGQ